MKHSIYKTRGELPMYVTVRDMADLLVFPCQCL